MPVGAQMWSRASSSSICVVPTCSTIVARMARTRPHSPAGSGTQPGDPSAGSADASGGSGALEHSGALALYYLPRCSSMQRSPSFPGGPRDRIGGTSFSSVRIVRIRIDFSRSQGGYLIGLPWAKAGAPLSRIGHTGTSRRVSPGSARLGSGTSTRDPDRPACPRKSS